MVKVEFKKGDFVWIIFLIALLGAGVVYAYGSSDPTIMGHTASEIEGITAGKSSSITTGKLHKSSLSVKPSEGKKRLYSKTGSACIYSLKALNFEQLGDKMFFSYYPDIRFIIDGEDSGYIPFRYSNFPVEEIAYPNTNYLYQYVNIPETICYSDSLEIWAQVYQQQCSTCNDDRSLYFEMIWSEN